MPRCLELDHHADFRALLVRHLLQRTTDHNRRQKTTFVYYTSIDKVVSELSSIKVGGQWPGSFVRIGRNRIQPYSPSINNIQTVSNFYGVDSKMLSMRSQSLTTTTAETDAREKTQPWWLWPCIKMVSMTFYLFYIKLPPSWPQFLQPRALLKGLSAPFAASRHF